MAKTNNLRDFLQGIANAIRDKKGTSEDINAQDFEDEIASIKSGGWDISYEEYALALYYRFDKLAIFQQAWQDSQDSESVLFDIPLALVAPNQEMGGMTIDLYVGTNGQLQALYDACVNETIPPPIDSETRDVYYVNNVATFYVGDVSGDVGFPIPLYNFGSFNENDNTSFLIGDLTPLSMGLGLVLAKIVNVSIPNNNIVIQQGFEFENENGIILPNSVTSIGDYAFYYWTSNNQPLIIPQGVTSIGNNAFFGWEANNQLLVIPNSVTSIGSSAFNSWLSNNKPLVIPQGVTSIGDYAFLDWTSNTQPLVIPNSVTNIGNGAFFGWEANNQPLVIPDSVTSIGDYTFRSWEANNQPLVIPESVTSIGYGAFYGWEANNQPLVIPDSVTSIGDSAFSEWTSNNQPLVIPNSVTSIGEWAFSEWTSNNQPLVIPNSVTSIGDNAFYYWTSAKEFIMESETPPTITSTSFSQTNDAPIYVPDESVEAYKTATNWVNLASRIKGISEKE